MCIRRKTQKDDSKVARSESVQISDGPKRINSSELMSEASGGPESQPATSPRKGKPIYFTDTVPNETKPEQVQNRLVPVIKNLFDIESMNKTGGSSGLLAEKLAQKNKLDEAKDMAEQTCEEDCNYYHIRKDILAMVDKSNTKREDDTKYEIMKKTKGKEQPKKTVMYKKDSRQSKLKEEKGKSLEKTPCIDYDMENDVNEKNYMYNVKEIDYCGHHMLRCIEEDNLYKNVNLDSKLPDKVEPYGDLEILAKRRFTSCKVLRRNTLISTMLSMPSADEAEHAVIATAKHSEHCAIRFLPPTTLILHCDEMREDQTHVDMSDIAKTAECPNKTGPALTAIPLEPLCEKKKERRDGEEDEVMVEATCQSLRKTAEEM